MIQLEGRTNNPEKIMFRNASHSAGIEADWSRHAVKETVISAVSTICVMSLQHREPGLSLSVCVCV